MGDLRSALAASVAVYAVAVATPAQAQARSFNVPAQPALSGIPEFARQADIQILVSEFATRGRNTSAVRGRMSVSDGINRLLARSGLRVSSSDGRTITLTSSAAAAASGEIEAGSAAAETESAEIVVTGTNIPGGRNPTAPVTILNRQYIDSTGIGTTTRLIESLPQNFALANQASVSTPGVTSTRSQGESINLRGIGEGTTLVLLNGRRLPLGFSGSAVDISSLPLTAIDRVEVLTDGASAIYGSDAVGGVVNFILRQDFEGAEIRLRAGVAEGGVNEYRASQAAGGHWSSGGILGSVEFYHRDLLRTSDRDFVPPTSIIGSLFPRDENISVLVSAHQDLTSRLGAFTDVLYVHRDTYNQGGRVNAVFNEESRSKVHQISANLGLRWRFGGDWQLSVIGGYGNDTQHSTATSQRALGPGLLNFVFENQALDALANGTIFEFPGGPVRMALGASTRREELDVHNTRAGVPFFQYHDHQRVNSLSGELDIPIVGPGNAFAGARRLGISLAGRFDHYSNFGSSFDPRIGAYWELARGLTPRAAYGTSYLAPKLTDYNLGGNSAAALYTGDPGVPSGVSHQLQVSGSLADGLSAQKSRSYSAGFEYLPIVAPRLTLGLNYYDIEYRGQIGVPASTTFALSNPAAYAGIVIRNPTVAQVNQYIAIGQLGGTPFFAFTPAFGIDTNFNPASIDAIVDFRRRNLNVVRTRGLDLSAQYAFSAGSSEFSLGMVGTYIMERKQRATAASTAVDTVATVNNPPDWRLRANAGWRHGGWAANLFVNYTDSYRDTRRPVAVAVNSYTVVDATLSYAFGAQRGPLSGVRIALNAQNLFDQDPPPIAIIAAFDLGFDTANANPLGRLVSFEISKRF